MDNKYHIKWFDCDQVPRSIISVLGMDTSPRYMEPAELEPATAICESDESENE